MELTVESFLWQEVSWYKNHLFLKRLLVNSMHFLISLENFTLTLLTKWKIQSEQLETHWYGTQKQI